MISLRGYHLFNFYSSKKPLLGVEWGHKLKSEVYVLKEFLLQVLVAHEKNLGMSILGF